MQVKVTQELAGSLVNNAEQNPKRDVENQPATDDRRGAILVPNVFVRGFAVLMCGKAVPFRAHVLLNLRLRLESVARRSLPNFTYRVATVRRSLTAHQAAEPAVKARGWSGSTSKNASQSQRLSTGDFIFQIIVPYNDKATTVVMTAAG